MTSLAQIRRWTRPLLAVDSDLVLIGRSLFIKPVRHVLRGLLIDRTSSAEWSRVYYALVPLFEYPRRQMGFRWSNQLDLGANTEPGFVDEFLTKSRGVITEVLSGGETIADFVSQIEREGFPSFRRLGGYELAAFPQEHCVVLAATGELERASAVLTQVTSQEHKYRALLRKGELERAVRPRSANAKFDIEWATSQLEIINHLQQLKEVIDREDRAGLGKLLRDWERHNAKLWGVEHLWEPTPFPVERT